ncbi:hypothetical protein [Streptomyces antibioticus]|nr:hypothetical protein [Streptomyces antibioticus]MCX5173681.1 hypothetical protein [Streptomyces antibioticus]
MPGGSHPGDAVLTGGRRRWDTAPVSGSARGITGYYALVGPA